MAARVTKITANTIVCEGLENTKVGNIVLIGEKKIYGEVMAISGAKTVVQAYEDTTGLRAGDEVQDMNGPLSIELGPGLIGGIFGGTGRDLEKEGDFLESGLLICTLDHSKKWPFSASKKTGEKVIEGDVIGTVRETTLINTKIMVPFGISGTLTSIKDGEFTLDEPVAVLKDETGKSVDLKMVQTWPVKTPRPFKDKKAVYSPLLSGQRVFDAIFPVHKGGTAALPGGFGVGKCVTGDTAVTFADGSFSTMEEIYSRERSDTIIDGDDEFIRLRNDVKLLSLNNNAISKSSPAFFYKGKSSKILNIRTRTGRDVGVTPVHKLFKICVDGEIRETAASELRPGDFIASVRKIDVDNPDAFIDAYSLPDTKVLDTDIRAELCEIVKYAVHNRIKLGLSYRELHGLSSGTLLPKLSLVKKIYEKIGRPLPRPKMLGHLMDKGTRMPVKMTSELAEFLGYFVSKGHIRNSSTLVFANPDENLLDRFMCLSSELFGLSAKKEHMQEKTPNVIVTSKVLVDFIKNEKTGKTAKEKRIPASIVKSSNGVLASFITAYYLSGGSSNRHAIELSTTSRNLQLDLSHALSRFGILHSLKKKTVNDTEYYQVFVFELNNMRRFYSILTADAAKTKVILNYITSKKRGYSAIDIVPIAKETLVEVYNKLQDKREILEEGMDMKNYIYLDEKMSVSVFKKFASFLTVADNNQLQAISRPLCDLAEALEYIFCDEIVEVKEESGSFDVYDFSLPDYGKNFIGGAGGLVLHNTVSEHQFAKFSDTDISVYVGCGERGNEMADVLNTFPDIKDPNSGKPIMQKMVLIANTSNMPIIAREASIFTGVTIAEFYRDMGYSVLLTADSTSRWAEALRQLGSELGDMPVEEGYPASLTSSLAVFYSRAGVTSSLGSEDRVGSVTIIGAVSPQGGDFSEPVTQATMRFVDSFWELDTDLAHMRHYPPVNWTHSYSLTVENMRAFYETQVGAGFFSASKTLLDTLHTSDKINEIASIIGRDALPDSQAVILQLSDAIKLYFLQQNAFDPKDAYTPIKRTYVIMQLLSELVNTVTMLIAKGVKYDIIKKDEVWSTLSNLTGDGDLSAVKKALEKTKTSYKQL